MKVVECVISQSMVICLNRRTSVCFYHRWTEMWKRFPLLLGWRSSYRRNLFSSQYEREFSSIEWLLLINIVLSSVCSVCLDTANGYQLHAIERKKHGKKRIPECNSTFGTKRRWLVVCLFNQPTTMFGMHLSSISGFLHNSTARTELNLKNRYFGTRKLIICVGRTELLTSITIAILRLNTSLANIFADCCSTETTTIRR